MLHLALRSLRANWARLAATIVAIVLGVGFLAAGRILTAAVSASLRSTASTEYAAVAAVVQVPEDAADTGAQVPAEALDVVRGVQGVAAATGRVSGTVAVLDGDRRVRDSVGRNWVRDPSLNPLEIAEGRAPRADDEVVLDKGLADDAGVSVGDEVRLATSAGLVTLTVVGESRAAGADTLDDGGTVSFTDADAFEYVNGGQQSYVDILVRAPDVAEGVIVRRIEQALPAGLEVEEGETFRAAQADLAAGIADTLSPVLQAFGFLTLFVCGFVIYNTFSVVVAQRQRELALMRAIGATPAQVRRSVRLEGLGVGLVGSVLGLLVGIGFAKGLQVVLELAGIDIPGGGVKVTVATVVLCLLVGTGVTVLSVLPAGRRAARTAPIEALRATGAGTSAVPRGRAVTGLVLVLGGAAVLVAGTLLDLQGRVVAAAAVGFLAGVFVAGPTFASGLGAVVRRPLSALGFQGRLADDGLVRNPRRSATTANALIIGVFLVTLVTVSGSAMRSWAVEEINKLSSADFTLTAEGGTLSADVLSEIESAKGVQVVAPVTASAATVDGKPATISTGDLARLEQAAEIEADRGSLDRLADGGVAVVAVDDTVKLGSTVTVETPDGRSEDLPVVATLKVGLNTLGLDRLVAPDTFATLFDDQEPQTAYVRVESGAFDEVRREIDRIVAPYANVSVSAGNELGRAVGDLISFLIDAVNALLLMAIIVALVGIVNTLSLSIIERRRELGLLRAVGMTPAQVRASVRWESLAIASLGTGVGILAGALLGLVAVSSIGISGALNGVDWWRVAAVATGGVLVGVLAALVPAWRATKVDILDALRAT